MSLTSNKGKWDLMSIAGDLQVVKKCLEDIGCMIQICGSVRRRKTVVGDIDLVVSLPLLFVIDELKQEFGCHIEVLTDVKETSKKCDVRIGGVLYNIYVSKYEYWGAMVLFLTGNRLFNVIVRAKAKKDGYKLSQYGLFLGQEVLAGKTELQIFDALGLVYVRPIDRDFKAGDHLKLKET